MRLRRRPPLLTYLIRKPKGGWFVLFFSRPQCGHYFFNNGAMREKRWFILKGLKAWEDGKGNEANEFLPLKIGHVCN